MPPKKKKSPPKHLEKMLFINHKEDQLLQDRLDQLHLKSRVREIELDRERLNVRNELRESKKKQIPVSSNNPMSRPHTTKSDRTVKSKPEEGAAQQDDNVNAYLLGEYRRMSEVIPSILLNLSAKDEAKQKMKSVSMGKLPQPASNKNDPDQWEPDMEKFSKTVSIVKAIRHNMAINKKLENFRPTTSLAKVFREIYAKEDHLDQFTDGACVLLKRKIEKRRRTSLPNGEPPAVMKRRHSSQEFTSVEPVHVGVTRNVSSTANQKRHSVSLPSLPRMGSILSPRSLSRSGTSLSAGARRRDASDKHTQFIDEDELLLRKRVACELQKYEKIKEKVDTFLIYPKRVIHEEPLVVS